MAKRLNFKKALEDNQYVPNGVSQVSMYEPLLETFGRALKDAKKSGQLYNGEMGDIAEFTYTGLKHKLGKVASAAKEAKKYGDDALRFPEDDLAKAACEDAMRRAAERLEDFKAYAKQSYVTNVAVRNHLSQPG